VWSYSKKLFRKGANELSAAISSISGIFDGDVTKFKLDNRTCLATEERVNEMPAFRGNSKPCSYRGTFFYNKEEAFDYWLF